MTDWNQAAALVAQIESGGGRAADWIALGDRLSKLGELDYALLAFDSALTLERGNRRARRGRKSVEKKIRRHRAKLARAPVDDLWTAIAEHGPAPGRTGAGRGAFTDQFAWATPSREAIDAIRLHAAGPILEIGSGRGLWARLLRDAGAFVFATDPGVAGKRCFTQVSPLTGEEALSKHREARCLLLCWPPPKPHVGGEAISAFTGDRLAYVGELGAQRVTGDDTFIEALERDWTLRETVSIPVWPGFSDALHLYSR